MDRIVVSDVLKIELGGIAGPVQLVDTTGVPIGQFLPQFVKLEDDCCPYSETELEQARREPGGRALADIWKSLDGR